MTPGDSGSKKRRVSRKSLTLEEAETSRWREPDTSGWGLEDRRRYNRYKSAIVDYIGGEKVTVIEEKYGIYIGQLYEQIWRATQLDAAGEMLGFYCLIPHLVVTEPLRESPPPAYAFPSGPACTGALTRLLVDEDLYGELENKVLKRGPGPHSAKLSTLKLQKWITGVLTERGYKESEYPFNTRRPIYSSLARLVARIRQANMAEDVQANDTPTAAGNLGVQNGAYERPPRTDPLDEVEADEHKLHGIGSVRITIDGVDKIIPVDRPVGVVICDRSGGTILGGAVCLNKEAKEEALIEAIRSAVIPGYVVRLPNGEPAPPFRPSDFYPELAGGVWTSMYLDNAKIHTGNRYLSTADHLAAQTFFGPIGSWSGRPNIESVFANLVNQHFSHLPSTTATPPTYSNRREPAEEAVKWEISVDDICKLFYQGLAEINQSVSEGVLYQPRVDAFRNYFRSNRFPILRRLPPVTAKRPQVGEQAVRRRVNRRSHSNPNLYINYAGEKYTSKALSLRADLLGEYIIIHVASNLRSVLAFELSGVALGVLEADGYWGTADHTLEIRQAVRVGKNAKFGQHGEPKGPIPTLLEEKAKKVLEKNSRRKRGEVVKDGLNLAHQMQVTSTKSIEITTAVIPATPGISVMTTSAAAAHARQLRDARLRLQTEGPTDE